MMEKKIARDFQTSVKSLLEDEDPETIYATLKAYHQSKDVEWLVDRLITVVDRPSRRPLFDQVRKLIPTKQQMAFDALLPHAASDVDARIRVVRIAPKTPNQPLGFAVRGGFEHGIGFYVSEVEKDSAASQRGLCAGDQIVRVNGFCIDQCILAEVLQLIKLKPQLVLKVVTVGMIPVKDNVGDAVSWRYTDQVRKGDVVTRGDIDEEEETIVTRSGATEEEKKDAQPMFKSMRILVHKPENVTLGCTIYCGSETSPGIFVQSIRIGSLAEEVGLDVDDEIVSVNGAHFRQLRHSEAVVNLKTPLQLDMVVRRRVKDPSASSSTSTSPFMENIRHLESERVAELRLLAADVSADARRRRRAADTSPIATVNGDEAEAQRLKEQFEEQKWIEEEERRLKRIDDEKAEKEKKRRVKKEEEDRKILDRMEAVLDGQGRRVTTNGFMEEDGDKVDGETVGEASEGVEALEMVMNFDTEREDEGESVIEGNQTILKSTFTNAVSAVALETSGKQTLPHLSLSSPPSSLNASPLPSPRPTRAIGVEQVTDHTKIQAEEKLSEKDDYPLSSPSSDVDAGSEMSSTTIPKRPPRGGGGGGAFESHSQLHRFLQDAISASKPGIDDDHNSDGWFAIKDGTAEPMAKETIKAGNRNSNSSEIDRTVRNDKKTGKAEPSPQPPLPPPPPPLNPPPRQKKISAGKQSGKKTESTSATTSVLPQSTRSSSSNASDDSNNRDSVSSSRRPTLEELNAVKLRPTPKGAPIKTEHVRQASTGSEKKALTIGLSTPSATTSSTAAVPTVPSAAPSAASVKRQPSIPISPGAAFSSTQRPILVSPHSTGGGDTPRGTSVAAAAATAALASATAVGAGGDTASNAKHQASDQSTVDKTVPSKDNANDKLPEKSPRKTRRRSANSSTSPRNNTTGAFVNNASDSAIPETNIDGRDIKVVTIVKGEDPLDVTIEGGVGSPWDGVIVVSRVWEGGAIDKNGAIKTGDQLLMVEGVSLNGITLAEAQSAIKTAMRSAKESISFVIAVAEQNKMEVKL